MGIPSNPTRKILPAVLVAVAAVLFTEPQTGFRSAPKENNKKPVSEEEPRGLPSSYQERVLVKGRRPGEFWTQIRVLDRKGIPMTDLDLAAFRIRVRGRDCVDARDLDRWTDLEETEESRLRLRQIAGSLCDISYFANPAQVGKKPKILAVVVDISGSVAGIEPDGSIPRGRLQDIAGYVRRALTEIFDPADLYIFVRFASVYAAEGPTRDTTVFEKILLRPYDPSWERWTKYYSIIRVIADKLKEYRDHPKAILMFSDCEPFDRLSHDLGRVQRELDPDPSQETYSRLKARKMELQTRETGITEQTLNHLLAIGIPVYNVHLPDENRGIMSERKRSCHQWVRKTGGDIYYMSNPKADLVQILRDIETDADRSYLLAFRTDRAEFRQPEITVVGHDDWKVVFSEEFLAIGSRRESLIFRIRQGDPEERLDAAYFSRRFRDPEIRRTLRVQFGLEMYPNVKATIGDSLFNLAITEVCSSKNAVRDAAVDDIQLISPFLSRPEPWKILMEEMGKCLTEFRDLQEAVFSWWEGQTIPEIRSTLYSPNADLVRFHLETGNISRALRNAGKLCGQEVEQTLAEFLEDPEVEPSVKKKIRKVLDRIGAR